MSKTPITDALSEREESDAYQYDYWPAFCVMRTHARKLEKALRIIAGEEQCVDNLLGDKDVARAALAPSKLGGAK